MYLRIKFHICNFFIACKNLFTCRKLTEIELIELSRRQEIIKKLRSEIDEIMISDIELSD